MCFLYRSLKVLWHNKSRLITSKVESEWVFNYRIRPYLKNRKQSVQINNNFNSAKKVHVGVPQDSIDGPLIMDLLFSLHSIGKDRDIIKNLLQKDFRPVTEWFSEIYMVLNQKKCHYMCIGWLVFSRFFDIRGNLRNVILF